jgi:2-polyprenyl-3-methyl-5-hydroxy-6-metoxy-1,4-benzoquinol methylase
MPEDARSASTIGPRLEAFYELRANEWPAADPEAELRFEKALRAADLSSGERLLDLGARGGALAECARRLGLEIAYTGLDLSDENVSKAAALGIDVRHADVSKPLPVEDGAYDCVVCLELLEHVTTPVAVLEEISRVLKPDGRAVISVPNPYSWVEVYRELFGRPDTEGHLTGFTTPVMENLLALAGLRIAKRLGTSIRIPRTLKLVSTNSILARSRIFVVRPSDHVVFAGRDLW